MQLEPAGAPRGRPDPGADEALVELFADHHRSLVEVAHLLVGDATRAEEIVQDAFVDLHARWSRLDGPAAALQHLRRSVVDRSRSVLRQRAVVRALDERSVLRDVAGAEGSGAGPVRGEDVLAALDRLPSRQREVLVLRSYGRLAEPEVATAVGISTGAVRTAGVRGLRALSPVLGAEGSAPAAEERLREALVEQVRTPEAAPDALDRIQRRVVSGPAAPRVVPVRRPAVAVVASALVLATAVSVAVGLGARHPVAPAPVPPTAAPTAGPTTRPTADPGDPVDPPRSSVDIYRVRLRHGSPVLSVEAVAATPPFQPRVALDALFGTAPLAAADHSVLDEGRNAVGSTRETPDALVVDLRAADRTTRPPTPALGRAWLQALVHTTQSAYNSRLPVLVRFRGRPFTFYGVDTTRPLRAARLPEVSDRGIQLPRPGVTLTAPVVLSANLPAGDFEWFVLDTPGNAVFTEGTSGTAGPSSFTSDLAPGRYRFLVQGRTTPGRRSFRRDVGFDVAVPATVPPPATVPATDPPTTPLDAVTLYWATTDGRLVRELRPRRPSAEMLSDYFAVPPGAYDAARLEPTNRVSSVSLRADGAVVVGFSRLKPGPTGSTSLLVRQAQAFAATVRSVTGATAPVRVTLDGRPTTFLGRASLPRSLPAGKVDQDPGPYPQPAHEPGRAEVVGVSRNPAGPTTYVLYDAVTHEARARGTVPQVDPRTGRYAFAVAATPGRYEVAVRNTDVHEQRWLDTAELRVG